MTRQPALHKSFSTNACRRGLRSFFTYPGVPLNAIASSPNAAKRGARLRLIDSGALSVGVLMVKTIAMFRESPRSVGRVAEDVDAVTFSPLSEDR